MNGFAPTPYYEDDLVTLYCADCADVLPALVLARNPSLEQSRERAASHASLLWEV